MHVQTHLGTLSGYTCVGSCCTCRLCWLPLICNSRLLRLAVTHTDDLSLSLSLAHWPGDQYNSISELADVSPRGYVAEQSQLEWRANATRYSLRNKQRDIAITQAQQGRPHASSWRMHGERFRQKHTRGPRPIQSSICMTRRLPEVASKHAALQLHCS